MNDVPELHVEGERGEFDSEVMGQSGVWVDGITRVAKNLQNDRPSLRATGRLLSQVYYPRDRRVVIART